MQHLPVQLSYFFADIQTVVDNGDDTVTVSFWYHDLNNNYPMVGGGNDAIYVTKPKAELATPAQFVAALDAAAMADFASVPGQENFALCFS